MFVHLGVLWVRCACNAFCRRWFLDAFASCGGEAFKRRAIVPPFQGVWRSTDPLILCASFTFSREGKVHFRFNLLVRLELF